MLYGERAYLPTLINNDAVGMHYVFFESTMVDGGRSKNAVIQINSNDGINIASVTHTNVANENYNNKVAEINDRNKDSVDSYTSVKAVSDYVDNVYMPKSQLLDTGIKSISWNVAMAEKTITTTEDIYKQYRPKDTNTRYWGEFTDCPYFKNRQSYRITFNGTVYDNLVCDYGILVDDGTGSIVGSDTAVGGAWQLIGNKNIYDSRYESTGEPFCIMYVEHGGMKTQGSYYYSSTVGNGILLTRTASSNTLKIERVTIEQEELPKSLFNNYGYGDRTYQNIGNSTYPRVSLGQGNIVGRGGFAIGNGNIAVGQFCVATGLENQITGTASFSEGSINTINGSFSHAEGAGNIVNEKHCHAEGAKNTINGYCGHAEGYENTIENNSQGGHVEGNQNLVSGSFAHAEGYKCEAHGEDSHAEGIGTYAGSNCQHTQGKWNTKDTVSKYSHIVGNGTSDTERSNAHTLDWDGNAWYQGKVESASGVLKLGNTEVNETQLKALLTLLT